MDRILSRWNETGAFDDESNRMKTRPKVASKPESKESRRKGQAVEDLGSGFAKKGAVGKARQGVPLKGGQGSTLLDFLDSESEDELDMLSQQSASTASGKEDLILGPDGKVHEAHPNFPPSSAAVLKGLKFKKNKASQDSAPPSQRSDAPSSVLPVLKENANGQKPSSRPTPKSVAKPQPIMRQTSAARPRSPPARPYRKPSPDLSSKRPSTRSSKPIQEMTTSENTRPKPRPLGKPRVISAQLQPAPFPTLEPPSSPRRRRNTVSTTENNEDVAAPAPFPTISPASSPRPAKFPTLPALGSQDSQQKVKPPPSRSLAKPPVTQAKSAKGIKATGSKIYPVPSPLSSRTGTTNNGRKASKIRKKPTDSSSSEDSEVENDNVPKPQPFPMNTQILGSIGFPCTPPVAGPSRSGKRSSSDRNSSGSERENKKTRKDNVIIMHPMGDYDYEEDDTICMSPTRDPRTLCPYCDAPMPSSPTPLLTRLLASTALKSKPQARPGNPMGRKAPFTAFIAVCQRHRFETKILPEAETKGWPKSIEWTKLEGRVSRMKRTLQELIEDPVFEHDSDDDDIFYDDETRGLKAKCIFWKEVINEVKQKGSRAVAGVQGQFANFEKTQPGYYGERGSVIIHQTLYDLFPPTSIDPSHVAPLTPNEFLQRILVPEVGVRLIMEDKGLVGNDGVESAVQILRDSANYGVAMFPEDEGEWGKGEGGRGSDEGDEELGVADLIVMERARKRRKELEQEDEREEEELRLFDEDEKKNQTEKEKSSKKKEKGKSKKGKEKEVESLPDDPAPPPASRPRPRPLGKGSSGISALTYEMDGLRSSQAMEDGTTDNESEASLYFRTKRPRRRSPTVSNVYPKPDEEPSTRRVTRSVSHNANVDVDLCSSSDDSSQSEAAQKAQPRKVNKERNRLTQKANTRNSGLGGSDSDPVVVSTLTNPSIRRSNQEHQGDIDMEDTPMPPSRSRFSSAVPEGSRANMYPLQMAKERQKVRCAGGAEDQTPRVNSRAGWRTNMRDEPQDSESSPMTRPNSPDSHSWLLSDSQSSMSIT